MRNASDIFCLKEDVTDGMQMFSVNGSCPLKINRRNRARENECFEYGHVNSVPEQHFDRGDKEFDSMPGISESADNTDELSLSNDNECLREVPEMGEYHTSPPPVKKRDDDLRFRKVSDTTAAPKKKEALITASTIMRNPLTGAGMEIQEHKKPKKGPRNFEKWLW